MLHGPRLRFVSRLFLRLVDQRLLRLSLEFIVSTNRSVSNAVAIQATEDRRLLYGDFLSGRLLILGGLNGLPCRHIVLNGSHIEGKLLRCGKRLHRGERSKHCT